MLETNQTIIKHKLGLLNLAEERGCWSMSYNSFRLVIDRGLMLMVAPLHFNVHHEGVQLDLPVAA